MTRHVARLAAALSAFSLLLAAPAEGQPKAAPPSYKAPRTAWGDPDLTGMWPLEVGNTRMQRDPKYGDQAWLTDAEYAAAIKAAQARGEGAATRRIRTTSSAPATGSNTVPCSSRPH
jgi:hypothetical protein